MKRMNCKKPYKTSKSLQSKMDKLTDMLIDELIDYDIYILLKYIIVHTYIVSTIGTYKYSHKKVFYSYYKTLILISSGNWTPFGSAQDKLLVQFFCNYIS